ncbi:PAS domain-containing protein [Denitrobaculum tricleocarpae]|uniref:PAS domain-containing protein n=1 Tax=Denitrobaculum tricleocarpae TaxID=2591009 RepID=A0A545TFZ5_9PROT|nr:PAS domain-containing protein [Denitrobaculum tricleocarpae]TQV76101.1 PAS domain-containing protein [Denitrobaculum tricleocarpae]
MGDTPKTYDPGDLPDRLRQALEHWKRLKGARALPLRSAFDPLDVPSLLPHLLMVEVVRDGQDQPFKDFRFRLVGTYIDDRVKDSYTGKRLSEIEGKGPGSEVWNAYSEVEASGTPKLLSLNYIGPMDGIKKSWEIFLPFSIQGECVDFILVLIEFD